MEIQVTDEDVLHTILLTIESGLIGEEHLDPLGRRSYQTRFDYSMAPPTRAIGKLAPNRTRTNTMADLAGAFSGLFRASYLRLTP